MRYVIGCSIVVSLACGIAFTQDDSKQAPSSLLELLSSEKAVGYRSADSVYQIRLLTDHLLQASRRYYENRSENISKAEELRREMNELRRKGRPGFARENPDFIRLQNELKNVSRPTVEFRVGEVTQRGTDYVGLQELGTTKEILIPVHRIQHVIGR